jgi:type II secretory pathway component PulJ
VNARIQRLWREEGGFTLPEMLVTIMIMITVLFALYSIFDMSIRVFSFGNDKVEAVENARLGLEKMEREIRDAYPRDKANGNTTLFPSLASNSITFGNDTNGDRKITAPGEEITYRLSGSAPYSLLRANPSNDSTPDPVIEFVKAKGLTFQYLDQSGYPTTTESEVSRVRIELETEINRGNLGTRTQTLTTDVDLRNR